MQIKLSEESFLAGIQATKAAVENGSLQEAFRKCAAVFKNSPDQNKQLADLLESFSKAEREYNEKISPSLTNSLTLYSDMRELSEDLKKLNVTEAIQAADVGEGPKLGRSSGIRK